MNLLNFSNTKSGRTFSLSLTIFTVYTLTYFFRGLSVMGIQMPIIILCYILLLSSCSSSGIKNATNRVVGLTIVLLFFDYFFVYLQDQLRFTTASLQNQIGFNYSIFVSFFPVLFAASGMLSKIDRNKFLNFIYILTIFTSITTIIGTYLYDSPCRELATPDNLELDRLYKSQNVGGYGFIYFLVLFTPIVLRDLFQKFSIQKATLLVLYGFCILRSEYTTALLLYIVAIAIVFALNSKSTILKIVTVVAGIALIVSFQSVLDWASSSLFEQSYTMSKRFEMMSDYSEYGEAYDDMGNRQFLYMLSINAFLSSPLVGNLMSFSPNHLGGHSEILDYLGNSGLFGLFVLIFLIAYLRKNTPLSRINMKDPYIRTVIIVAFLLAVMNTFLVPELYLALIIVPLLADYENRMVKRA